MKKVSVQKNFLGKLNQVKKLVEGRFPWLEMRDFGKMMSTLAHYHYHKKDCMIVHEYRELYNFLIENSYNPFTVYRWILLERIPQDIRFQLRQGSISQKKALRDAFNRRRKPDSNFSVSLREQGLKLIGGM